MTALRLPPDWDRAIGDSADLDQLAAFLDAERAAGRDVVPPEPLVLEAFRSTPLDSVRAVILGQDPYHGPGQATGMCFAVPGGVPQPPSLRNLLRELSDDLGVVAPSHGDLSAWAGQGVLLLNTTLTVGIGEPGSHTGRGWEQLTDAAIAAVSARPLPTAFLLWGRHAQAKRRLVDERRHLVLAAAHPSPLSASRGFFGCRHFSRANAWLEAQGREPIDWALPETPRVR